MKRPWRISGYFLYRCREQFDKRNHYQQKVCTPQVVVDAFLGFHCRRLLLATVIADGAFGAVG